MNEQITFPYTIKAAGAFTLVNVIVLLILIGVSLICISAGYTIGLLIFIPMLYVTVKAIINCLMERYIVDEEKITHIRPFKAEQVVQLADIRYIKPDAKSGQSVWCVYTDKGLAFKFQKVLDNAQIFLDWAQAKGLVTGKKE